MVIGKTSGILNRDKHRHKTQKCNEEICPIYVSTAPVRFGISAAQTIRRAGYEL